MEIWLSSLHPCWCWGEPQGLAEQPRWASATFSISKGQSSSEFRWPLAVDLALKMQLFFSGPQRSCWWIKKIEAQVIYSSWTSLFLFEGGRPCHRSNGGGWGMLIWEGGALRDEGCSPWCPLGKNFHLQRGSSESKWLWVSHRATIFRCRHCFESKFNYYSSSWWLHLTPWPERIFVKRELRMEHFCYQALGK